MGLYINQICSIYNRTFGVVHIASESDVVEPGDDTPIVSLFQMATRDKLMCVADSVVYLQTPSFVLEQEVV